MILHGAIAILLIVQSIDTKYHYELGDLCALNSTNLGRIEYVENCKAAERDLKNGLMPKPFFLGTKVAVCCEDSNGTNVDNVQVEFDIEITNTTKNNKDYTTIRTTTFIHVPNTKPTTLADDKKVTTSDNVNLADKNKDVTQKYEDITRRTTTTNTKNKTTIADEDLFDINGQIEIGDKYLNPKITTTERNYVNPTKKPPIGGKSINQCSIYANLVYRNQSSPTLLPGILHEIVDTCDSNNSTEKVLPKEFPHLASLGYSGRNPTYKCTGALISDEYVLTSAYCANYPLFGVPDVVRLGTTIHQHNYFEYPHTQVIGVAETVIHPKYNKTSGEHDLALIKLADRAKLNSYVRPACLGHDKSWLIKSGSAIVVGYGSLTQHEPFGVDLKKNNIVIGRHNICAKPWQKYQESQLYSSCAHLEIDDRCVIDRGAPLQVLNDVPYCTYDILGVVSQWDGCKLRKPITYAKVTDYIEWIEDNVWTYSKIVNSQ